MHRKGSEISSSWIKRPLVPPSPPHLLTHLILHPRNGANAPIHQCSIDLSDARACFQYLERLLAVCDTARCEDNFSGRRGV